MDIITHSIAVQKSLGSLNKLVLENHLLTHIKDMDIAGEVDKAVEELLSVHELAKIRSK